MEREQAKNIIEALLYMTDHALSPFEISQVLELKTYTEDVIRDMLGEISKSYDERGSALRVVEVAGGFQVATRPDMATWIRRLYKERLTVRLSPSSLETLSIIAYKQPITRGEIEQIRGVEASGVMETLLERRLIKVVGRKETIGRPLLYGTTTDFLRHFGLRHLSELPDLNTLEISTTPDELGQPELGIDLEQDPTAGTLAEATGGEAQVENVATAVLEQTPPPPSDADPQLN